jgi:hypothetical protein
VGRFLAACVAIPVLAACGGTDGSAARTEPSADGGAGKATSAAEGAEPTRASVKREIQRAVRSGGFDRPRFTDLWEGELASHCVVRTQLRTREDPQERAVRTVIADLEKSGWSRTGASTEDYGSSWSLERQHWTLDVMTGSVTPDQLVEGRPARRRTRRRRSPA